MRRCRPAPNERAQARSRVMASPDMLVLRPVSTSSSIRVHRPLAKTRDSTASETAAACAVAVDHRPAVFPANVAEKALIQSVAAGGFSGRDIERAHRSVFSHEIGRIPGRQPASRTSKNPSSRFHETRARSAANRLIVDHIEPESWPSTAANWMVLAAPTPTMDPISV